MKTADAIKAAVAKYETELATIRERIDGVNQWLDAAEFMRCEDLFVAQVKERDELRCREKEMDFKIRFAKWVLE